LDDVDQPSHERGSSPSPIGVHVLAVVLAVAYAAVWYVWRPAEGDVTAASYVAMSEVKLLVIAALLWQLWATHVRIGRGAISANRAVVGWTLGLVAALAILTPFREWIGATFDASGAHLVRPSEEIGYAYPWRDSPTEEQLRHRHFVVQWRRGEVLGIEALLAAIIALAHVVTARSLGRAAGILSVLVAGTFTLAACWAFCRAFGLALFTYDDFYVGALAGPLGLDLLLPTARYPVAPLAAPFYVAFAVSSWAVAAGRSAPAPELGGRSEPSAVAHVEG
jgi:hypothetical protein